MVQDDRSPSIRQTSPLISKGYTEESDEAIYLQCQFGHEMPEIGFRKCRHRFLKPRYVATALFCFTVILLAATLHHVCGEKDQIPNYVHFVRQTDKDHQGNKLPLRFEFKNFMAVYSAHYWLKPDTIFIWTDAPEDSLPNLSASSDPFTKAVATLANIEFRYREMPNVTKRGVAIKEYAHKSDFVRAEVMLEHGGVYLDDDTWILKDLKALRRAGYANVFGRQYGGLICQAMWMSKPHNPFMQAWVDLQENEFNGAWTKAGNDLITQLYLDFSRTSSLRHALVLEQDAFFPSSWNPEPLADMYSLHGISDQENDDLGEPEPLVVERIKAEFSTSRTSSWKRDWSSSYSIHGWSTGIKIGRLWHLFGPYGHLSPDYVLSKRSNVARALYPMLKIALESEALVLD